MIMTSGSVYELLFKMKRWSLSCVTIGASFTWFCIWGIFECEVQSYIVLYLSRKVKSSVSSESETGNQYLVWNKFLKNTTSVMQILCGISLQYSILNTVVFKYCSEMPQFCKILHIINMSKTWVQLVIEYKHWISQCDKSWNCLEVWVYHEIPF